MYPSTPVRSSGEAKIVPAYSLIEPGHWLKLYPPTVRLSKTSLSFSSIISFSSPETYLLPFLLAYQRMNVGKYTGRAYVKTGKMVNAPLGIFLVKKK